MCNYHVKLDDGDITVDVDLGKKGKGFRAGTKGKLFLIRCPKCARENYGPAVADGLCVWCGWKDGDKY